MDKAPDMNNLHWDDFKIAQQVASSGTLTAAGENLGINHATVLRHINRLESALDAKLFLRHQRGYELTEAGQHLMRTMPSIQNQFKQLIDNIQQTEKGLAGTLTLTTVADFALILNPVLKQFQHEYPDIRIQIIATDDRIPLESGEAHASLRMTTAVREPDTIAHKITKFDVQLWASDAYIEEYGIPKDESEYHLHKWILPNGKKENIPYIATLLRQIPPEQLVYRSNSFRDIHSAVFEGMGIGPVSEPHTSLMTGLKPLPLKLDRKGDSALWFVYHKSQKNNQKIKKMAAFLKENMRANNP